MKTFTSFRDTILDEMIRHEGRHPQGEGLNCQVCDTQMEKVFKCLDCTVVEEICSACIVASHSVLPLHRVQVSVHIFPSFVLLTRIPLFRSGLTGVGSVLRYSK